MALSHLLQQKLNLRVCRLSFCANARFCTSLFPNGNSDDSPPPKNEAAAEKTEIMAVKQTEKEFSRKSSGFFSKATSVTDLMAGYVGSIDSRLSPLFINDYKDDLTKTTAENEGRKSETATNELLGFLDEHTQSSNSNDKCSKFTELLKVPIPTSNEDQMQRQKTCSARTESMENRVLVRFLRSNATKNMIHEYFSGCGQILKIEVHNAKLPPFKTACIDFKTREGVEKALKKSGTWINGEIVVESATLMENMNVKIPIPCLLDDPNIPSALIKNPTRTIKIQHLTPKISTHHIEGALAFCESNISGYSMGFSHSVAYVEFETETGKERALAQQSINVLGRRLVLLRIDCPRTTVVRISYADYLGDVDKKVVMSICKSLGYISSSLPRCPGVLDVQFKLSEWPNMVKILNSLNGHPVGGKRLLAEPAPVFPPEVLLALWHHPEERKHLQATVQFLLHKLSENTFNPSELAFLENDLFRV